MDPSRIPPVPWRNPLNTEVTDEMWEESYKRMFKGCQAIPGGDPSKLYEAFEKIRRGEVEFDDVPLPTGIGRAISVPLQKLDKCSVCEGAVDLRLCSSCASAIYCSRECQRFAWKDHKRFCSQTKQINLKTFYPFIAYMMDTLRRVPPTQDAKLPPSVAPFLASMFERIGQRPNTEESNSYIHPALCHRILKAPTPGARRATESENLVHHTVVLGETYDLQISSTSVPNPQKLNHWWRGRQSIPAMQLYLHVSRERYILEITLAISLILLSEVYSTHMTKTTEEAGESKWEPRSCYRLEYGHSPVSDFGICRGRIQGKANRVQTWTYYEPKANTRATFLDPDRHYWLYLRTIKGEELVLDCCSFSYGMEACVDAAPYISNLSEIFRKYGSARTPAYLYSPSRPEECPNTHKLIEEKRFSIMQNTSLFGALGWEVFGGQKEDQHVIIRDFISQIQGKPCTQEQEDRVRDYRTFGALMVGQVLSGKLWKEWGKATVHPRDECFDPKNPKKDEWIRGSPEDPACKGKLNGMMGLFGDVLGLKY